MQEFSGKPGGTTLGSTMQRLEWYGSRAGGNTHKQIGGQIRAQNSRVQKDEEKEKGIWIMTLNIRSGQTGGGGGGAARPTAGNVNI